MTGIRVFVSSLYYAVIILATVVVHVAVIEFLPYPFNQLNTIFLVTMGLLILTVNIKNLWVSFLFGFILELLSSFPFGVVLGALLFSSALVYWILTNIFTHRSLYIVFFTGGIGILAYRFTVLGLLFFRSIIHHETFLFNFQTAMAALLVEFLVTTTALILLYVLSRTFIKKLRPEYVNSDHRLI